MKNTKIIGISVLLERVNKNRSGIFNKESEVIAILPEEIALIMGDTKINISEFIIAKIKGFIKKNIGHNEITDSLFCMIPNNLCNPKKILQDTRSNKKYLFISVNPLHEIVVEISRNNLDKSEINTIHLINYNELRRLEIYFPVVFSSGGTPGFPHTCIL